MGILNVTPDSFSDGNEYLEVDKATQHGLHLLDLGASILDVGAESTRPNAERITPTQEQARLLPVLEAIRQARPQAILSVDTYHSSTARAAMEAGVEIINDVSGLTWDESMARTLAGAEPCPGLVLMHTRGTPQQWHALPRLDPPTIELLVRAELSARITNAEVVGIPSDRMILDPGFGFGKLGNENFALLARLSFLHALNLPLLVGLSRKRFLAPSQSPAQVEGILTNSPLPAAKRLHATIAANTAAILAGVHVIRVHDVAAAVEAAAVADELLSSL